jgi:hypothetical protein
MILAAFSARVPELEVATTMIQGISTSAAISGR